ncbi:hypothetical protein IP86_10925 [Rhodopseudomonas sp. AAP120]|uniref:hypothetical protein n=1 Tax=Rhodopseudomonas sp. AAP120 TaxID=1523430 RepID=UPI0006B96229|nr:hypothetical protein [Rhodopseudomonas sp. AAP120]KPF98827.1 hypothetical protein IP86_10925 [Rhodopseudomonas sp. AAP120]
MRQYGFKTSTSIDRVANTVLISIVCEDERMAEAATELLRRRQMHGALTIDLQRTTFVQLEGSCERQ